MNAEKYEKAVEHLSTQLLLPGAHCADTLIERSKAWAMMKSWDNALKDAQEVRLLLLLAITLSVTLRSL